MARPLSRTARWLGGAALLLAAAVVTLALLLDDLRTPQPLRFRMDLAARGTPLKTVTVYLAHPDSSKLVPVTREIVVGENESRTAGDLVAHLTRSSAEGDAPLPEGTELLHFFRDGEGGVVLDFNEKLIEVEARGIGEERLRLDALTRTVTENLDGIGRLWILVHGRPLERWGTHLDLEGTEGGVVP